MAVEWDPKNTTAEEKEAILEAPVVRGRGRIASRRVMLVGDVSRFGNGCAFSSIQQVWELGSTSTIQ